MGCMWCGWQMRWHLPSKWFLDHLKQAGLRPHLDKDWKFSIEKLQRFPQLACSKLKIPWRKKWPPAPVFLPAESQGQRSLAGCHPRGRKASDTAEHSAYKLLSISLQLRDRLSQRPMTPNCSLLVMILDFALPCGEAGMGRQPLIPPRCVNKEQQGAPGDRSQPSPSPPPHHRLSAQPNAGTTWKGSGPDHSRVSCVHWGKWFKENSVRVTG